MGIFCGLFGQAFTSVQIITSILDLVKSL